MPFEPRSVSEESQEAGLGSLRGCLVEGDPEQRNRERRVRRRALVISVLVQTAVLSALILLPLLGKTQHIALAITTPIPPYGRPHRAVGTTKPTTGHPRNPVDILVFPSPTAKPFQPSNGNENAAGPPDIGLGAPEGESGLECSWCIDIGGKDSGPRPPKPIVETPSKPRVIHRTTIDPAMLIRRVEPIYPPLPKQMHREGRVELRAIIGVDGNIQSLQVVAGDPLFIQSALEAVQQWHYKPTYLNGQPVEIDTYITVVYTMQH
jgi:protein TonB